MGWNLSIAQPAARDRLGDPLVRRETPGRHASRAVLAKIGAASWLCSRTSPKLAWRRRMGFACHTGGRARARRKRLLCPTSSASTRQCTRSHLTTRLSRQAVAVAQHITRTGIIFSHDLGREKLNALEAQRFANGDGPVADHVKWQLLCPNRSSRRDVDPRESFLATLCRVAHNQAGLEAIG
jgi:hypothetical protein